MSNTVSASLPYYMPDNNPKYLEENILFAEPFQLLELVQLVGCLTLSHFWNCLSAVSDCWQEVSGWERTFPFFETQVKCGFRVGPVSQGWHTFQRISVFHIFVIVYFCCILVGHFWNCSSAISDCWQLWCRDERGLFPFSKQVKWGFRVGLASQDDRGHTFQEEGWCIVTKQKLSQRELIALELKWDILNYI